MHCDIAQALNPSVSILSKELEFDSMANPSSTVKDQVSMWLISRATPAFGWTHFLDYMLFK